MGDEHGQENPGAWWQKFVAGIVGGYAVVAVGHPFDTIKVRMQTAGVAGTQAAPTVYNGALSCLVSTWRNEGIAGLYKGVRAPLSGVPWIYCISFGAWGVAQDALMHVGFSKKEDNGSMGLTIPGLFLAGGASGAAQSVVFAPTELIKKRLQTQYNSGATAKYTGMLDCARKIVATQGVRGLYTGYTAVLVAYVPGCAMWYGSYDVYRRTFNADPRHPTVVATLLAGGMAGVTAWAFCYPMDLVAARIQTAEPGQYAGWADCIKRTYADGGVAGFYRGLAPCILRAFPADGACFLAYEMVMKLLRIYA